MAVAINTVSTGIFSLNTIEYSRIYLPLAVGANNIAIYGVYDSTLQILSSTPFGEFSVNGAAAPVSQAAALAELNPILFVSENDAISGGGGLVASRISNFAQVADGSTGYVNIGAIGVSSELSLDGTVLQVLFSGTVDRVSGTPAIYLQGYSSNLIIGLVTAPAASNIAWEITAEIMRVSSSVAQWTATFKAEGQETQVTTGEKTGLDFTAAHTMSLAYQDHVNLDDFLMRFGYVNKLT